MIKQCLILLALGLALTSCAQNEMSIKIAAIDSFLAYNQNLNKFNGTVLIAQGEKILLNKGYGFRNFEDGILNDSSSIFQIYSITKTFTSTMILKLIEQKKLSLDTKLNKFYPTFPNGEQITIEHLLTHTSGINDDSDGQDAPITEDFRVKLFGNNKPRFAPGESWSYCNGGYQLLGYIIALIEKTSYEHAIRKNIFEPLGMSQSGFDFKSLSIPEKTTGYQVFTNEKKQTAELYDSLGPFSAGAIYSTVGDLYKYYKGIKSREILSEDSQSIAFTPSKTNKGYGHGWQIQSNMMNPTIYLHSGGAAGFRSNFSMIPDKDICIIILNNHENANADYLTNKILDVLNNKSIELTPEVILTNGQLQKFVGAYSLTKPRKMMIYTSILDGRLALQVDGQNKSTVIAKNENTFIQDEAGAILSFSNLENGVYKQMDVKQGGRNMEANWVESTWGLIGSATSKGWDDVSEDIKMIQMGKNQLVWQIKNISLNEGEFKFRFNNDWSINYGDNNGDKKLDLFGANIKVTKGIYDIILDLTDETSPQLTINMKE